MFFYITPVEDQPAYLLNQFQKKYHSGELDNYTEDEHRKILEQIKAWELAKGKNLYTPNSKSQNFFLAWAMVKLISGGNRSGKTLTCAMDVIMQAEGWHPLQRENLEKLATKALNPDIKNYASQLLDEKKWYVAPPVAARCEVVDFPSGCEKIAGPTVMEWADKTMIKDNSYDNEKKRRIVWKNGSFLEFMSHDQDLDSHGGVSRDVIWEDEEPPSEIHQENLARILDCGGRIVMGMTAVKGITWVKDEIYDPWEKGKKKNLYCIKMRTIDNPIMTDKMVDAMKDQCLDQDEIAIRLEGEFRSRGGLVYFMAKDKNPWIIDPFDIPEDKGVFLLNIDTHIATPHGLLWQWVDYDGVFHDLIDGKPNYYNVREMFMNGTVYDIDNWIKVTEEELGRNHGYMLLEQAAWHQGRTQTRPEEKDLATQFMDLGYYPERASKDLAGGIQFVRSLLLLKEDHPRLMTFKTCERLRWERGKYQTPDLTGKAKDRRAAPDKPYDKDDHFMECERRGCQFVNDVRITDILKPDLESPPQRKKKKHFAPDGTLLNVDFDEKPEDFLPYNTPEEL